MQIITQPQKRISLPPPLAAVLPPVLRDSVERHADGILEELRLYAGRRCSLVTSTGIKHTDMVLHEDDLSDILKKMCGGSLYAFSQSICQGYLPLGGGVRVGVAGRAATEGGRIIGVSNLSALIVRIPNAIRIEASPLLGELGQGEGTGGLLLYAPPGVGKTTLLRSLAREASEGDGRRRTVVVDSREELCETLGGEENELCTLSGYPRRLGIEIAVRTLGAELILCDEIGSPEDADAILSAANCGVPLIATAHAKTLSELLSRPALRRLHDAAVFGAYVGLRREGKHLQYKITRRGDAEGL